MVSEEGKAMSVEAEPKLLVGWRVKQDEIPDFDERWECCWPELEQLRQRASKLLEKRVFIEDLCAMEDSWRGDTQMVGVPMFDREMPMDEFSERTDKLAELAKDVYRKVMRKEPEDGPYLISWVQVS